LGANHHPQVIILGMLAAKHAKACFRISHADLLLFVLHVFCSSHCGLMSSCWQNAAAIQSRSSKWPNFNELSVALRPGGNFRDQIYRKIAANQSPYTKESGDMIC
jgi:hypothetical protein